jgi:PAS domain S-box-containing protein
MTSAVVARGPQASREHFVRFYQEDSHLYTSVGRFLQEGLECGEGIVVIATPEHREGFCAALREAGVDVASARERGDLTLLDAEETLSGFLIGDLSTGALDDGAFERLIGGMLDRAASGIVRRSVRAYGEMVSLLFKQGNVEATAGLEELWNRLARSHDFRLCCAYSMGDFNRAMHREPFRRICGLHTHVLPAESYDQQANGREQDRQLAALQQRAAALEGEVAHRKLIEDTLRRRDRELTDFLENATEGLHWVGPDGIVLWANRAELELLGYSRAEYVGRHVSEFHADAAAAADMLARLVGGEELRGYEARLVARDGSIKHVLINSSVYREDGRFVHTRCFTRDITDWKQAQAERDALLLRERAAREDAEKANRLKDEFLAMVSHELRTPLNAILGWTHVMRSAAAPQPDQTRRALEVIERNARIQTQIVADVLDISRITSGKLLLNPEQLDARPLVSAALEAIRPAAEARKIALRVSLPPDPRYLWADAARMQQVVGNLLSNAVKFTAPGGRVDVALESRGPDLAIVVRDTGKGIAAEFLPHVFERFRQADSSITRNHGGLGLGLAIVKHLVELHRGRVEASSSGEGRGATFRVVLPLMVVAAEAPQAEGRPAPRLDGVRALVVDDHEDGLELVAMILTQQGAEVIKASDAAVALTLLRDQRPNVLVSDLEMPGESGYDLVEKVRALPAGQGGLTPAIALTAFARPDDRVRALMAGFQAHLGKPMRPHDLAAVVAELVGQTRAV